MKNKLKIISLILWVLFAYSCKKPVEPEPDPDPQPNEEVIVFDITKVVDEETRAHIVTIDTADYTFTMDGESSLFSNLAVGDIIVDSVSEKAPYGYLRRVTGISGSKGNKTISTEQAILTDAIEQGYINFSSGKVSKSQLEKVKLADGVTFGASKNPDNTIFDLDYNEVFENEYGTVTVSGHADLTMDFYLEYDWTYEFPLTIKKVFRSGAILEQSASFSVVCEEGASIEQRIDLATFYFNPYVIMVGPVPVVFIPRVQVFVELDGTITAILTTSASESFHGQLGVDYNSERNPAWKQINEREYTTDYVAPNLNLNAAARVDVGPEIAYLLYGFAGPYVDATAFGDLSGTLLTGSGNWNLDLDVGVRSRVGVKAEVLGFDKNYEKDLFRVNLFHLENEPFGSGIFIQYPIENNSYPLGENINITTSFTGETPDEVEFLIDNVSEHTDTSEPFTYDWNTDNLSAGVHSITVNAKKDGAIIATDGASVNLYEINWSEVDLSSLGAGDQTTCTDVYFYDSSLGWITLAGTGYGKILKSIDGGNTWLEQSNTSFPMQEMVMFGTNQGIYLTYYNKVMFTGDGGQTIDVLKYTAESGVQVPTFQWKDIFDIATNMNEEIVAIGKDTGIPYYFHVYYANILDHKPVKDFQIPFPNEYGMAPGIETYGQNAIVFGIIDEDNPDVAYYMTSHDVCETWQSSSFSQITNSNTYLRDACYYTEDELWIVGSENGVALVMISTDGGDTWNKVTVPGVASFGSVSFVSAEVGYATLFDYTSADVSRLYKTTDGGYTWNPVVELTSQHPMSKVFFKGQNQGMVVGKGDKAYQYHL